MYMNKVNTKMVEKYWSNQVIQLSLDMKRAIWVQISPGNHGNKLCLISHTKIFLMLQNRFFLLYNDVPSVKSSLALI